MFIPQVGHLCSLLDREDVGVGVAGGAGGVADEVGEADGKRTFPAAKKDNPPTMPSAVLAFAEKRGSFVTSPVSASKPGYLKRLKAPYVIPKPRANASSAFPLLLE